MNNFNIGYSTDGDKTDFNLFSVPPDIMLSLSHALKWEFQKRMAAAVAPEFRKERALQQGRYIEQCQKTGDTPKQIFIDFPNY